MARFLSLILATALLLTGCGYELFMTVQRLGGTKDMMSVLPSWPVDLKLGLGGASMPVSSLIPTSSGGVTILNDGSYAMLPEPQLIPAIKIGDNLKVAAQAPIPIPIQSVPVSPPSHQEMATQSFTLKSMGVMDTQVPVPNPLLFPPMLTMTIGEILATDSVDADLKSPIAIPISKDESQTVAVGQLRGAKLAADSKITLRIYNDIGGADAAKLNLRLSNVRVTSTRVSNSTLINYDLNKTWRSTHANLPLNTGTTEITLDEDSVITGAISVSFSVLGQIGDDVRLKQLAETQKIEIGMGADIFIKAISLEAQELPTSSQSIDLPTASLAEQGIGSLSNIKIATGSVTMQVSNGFGVNVNLNLALRGVLDSKGDDFVYPGFLPAGTANAPTVTSLVIPLSGTTITGTHIDVAFTGYTYDTETKFPTIPKVNELPDGMSVFDTSQKLSGSVTVNELEFESILATLNKTVPIASSSTPMDLPADFKKLQVGLGRIGLQIQLDNQTQFTGTLALDAKVKLADGSWRPLDYRGNLTMAPATAPGETKVNLIDINETNSNLVDLINSGGTELSFGGTFAINSGTTPIQLTRHDQIGGKIAVSVPISLIFKEMGVGKEVPPYDVSPASPLDLPSNIKSMIDQGLVSMFALTLKFDNGLHIPLDLNLLISQTDDPFTDPAPLVRTISLGDGSQTQTSVFGLNAEEMIFLKGAKKMGFRVTSPGTHGQPISLRSTDQLRIAILAELKARLSAKAVQGMSGGQ